MGVLKFMVELLMLPIRLMFYLTIVILKTLSGLE